jgi:hypothetical protein
MHICLKKKKVYPQSMIFYTFETNPVISCQSPSKRQRKLITMTYMCGLFCMTSTCQKQLTHSHIWFADKIVNQEVLHILPINT